MSFDGLLDALHRGHNHSGGEISLEEQDTQSISAMHLGHASRALSACTMHFCDELGDTLLCAHLFEHSEPLVELLLPECLDDSP